MKKLIITILLLVFSFILSKTSLFAQAEKSSDLDLLNQSRLSPNARSIIAREVKNQITLPPFASSSMSTASDLISKANDVYLSEKEKNNPYSEVVKYSGKVLVGTEIAVGAAAATGVGALPAAGIGLVTWGATEVTDSIFESFDESAREAARESLRLQLSNLPQDSLKEWDNLKNLSPEDRASAVIQLTSEWRTKILEDIPDQKEREQVEALYNGYMIQAVQAQLAQESGMRELADQKLQGQIDESAKQVAAISRTMVNYHKEVLTNLNGLQTQMKGLESQLTSINQRVQNLDFKSDRLVRDLSFVQDFVFSRMTPDEQIRSLKAGMFPGMEDSQRKDLVAKIEVVQNQKQVIETASTVLEGATVALNLASKLGVDPKILNHASKIIGAGQAVTNFAGAVMTGNPVEAFKAIGSFFGLWGEDTGAKRHREIMNALSGLAKGQEAILKNQGIILEAIKASIELQKATLESIVALHKEIRANHLRVMERLDEIHSDVIYNRELLRAVLLKEVNACDTFLNEDTRKIFDGYNSEKKQFKTYDQLATFFANYSREFTDCIKGLEGIVVNDETALASLRLRTYQTEDRMDQSYNQFIKSVYTPIFDYTKTRLQTELGKTNSVFGLEVFASIPALFMDGGNGLFVDLKERQVRESDFLKSAEKLQSPFSNEHLLRYSERLLGVYPYLELVTSDANPDLIPLQAALQNRRPVLKGLVLLNKFKRWLNFAISHETILSGELVLDFMHRDWVADKVEDEAQRNKIVALIESNSLLATNFIRRSIQISLKNSQASLKGYALALSKSTDDYMLKQVMKESAWKFEYKALDEKKVEPHWYAVIGKTNIQLPSAEEMLKPTVAYRTDMYRLIARRDSFESAIADFTFESKLDPETKNAFQALWLRGI